MQEFLQAAVNDASDFRIAKCDALKKRFVCFQSGAVVFFEIADAFGQLGRHTAPECRKCLGGKRMRGEQDSRFSKGLGKNRFHGTGLM